MKTVKNNNIEDWVYKTYEVKHYKKCKYNFAKH